MKKILALIGFLAFSLTSCIGGGDYENGVRALVAEENRDLVYLLEEFGRENDIPVQYEIKQTREILDILDEDTINENVVWLSNSMWFSTLANPSNIKNQKSLFIDPVVFGVKKTKAEQLGFTNNEKILTSDILEKIRSGGLKFIMPSVTQTNAGASAYLGFLSTLLGNPEVIALEDLDRPALKNDLIDLFKGVERSSGSTEFSSQLISSGEYEAMVDYESAIINLNKELISSNSEPLYLVYPYDGVSLSDSPIAYISNSATELDEDIFLGLQKYLLKPETQQILTGHGRRAGYGGLVPYADKEVFNPDWGIDITKYISPIKYPATDVINKALTLYQEYLRKPTATVFCLDFSGSMGGHGREELMEALTLLFDNEESARLRIQFTSSDKVFLIPFDSEPRDYYSSEFFTYEEMLSEAFNIMPNGSTNIHDTLAQAVVLLDGIDQAVYNKSIVIMSDGKSNRGKWSNFESAYRGLNENIPVYSITFGDSDEDELQEIADYTNGLLFDGKIDLKSAFRTVRGYN
ncbi:MAG: VWA domain-containing protein [Clostridiales bacterium]|nr:VWA domain-containing protein [Clostridiales bacterium]